MTLNRRLALVLAWVAVALGLHLALLAHLGTGGTGVALPRSTLASIPMELQAPGNDGTPGEILPRTWVGFEHPHRAELAKQVPFADEFLYRAYQPTTGGPHVVLYAVYSREAEDRLHHPDICVRDVNGAREDEAARKVVILDGEGKRRVQRLRYETGKDRYVVIWYWHYTLTPTADDGLTALQTVHRRHGSKYPSITVQVSSEAPLGQMEAIERTILVAVDAELSRRVLPPTAVMGCDRAPVTLLRN